MKPHWTQAVDQARVLQVLKDQVAAEQAGCQDWIALCFVAVVVLASRHHCRCLLSLSYSCHCENGHC